MEDKEKAMGPRFETQVQRQYPESFVNHMKGNGHMQSLTISNMYQMQTLEQMN